MAEESVAAGPDLSVDGWLYNPATGEITCVMGLTANDDVTFHLRVEHWRDGVLVSVPVDESLTASFSGSGSKCSCDFICNTTQCQIVLHGNLGDINSSGECWWNGNYCPGENPPDPPVGYDHQCNCRGPMLLPFIDPVCVLTGDTYEFSIAPPPEFGDVNPDNNSLSAAF